MQIRLWFSKSSSIKLKIFSWFSYGTTESTTQLNILFQGKILLIVSSNTILYREIVLWFFILPVGGKILYLADKAFCAIELGTVKIFWTKLAVVVSPG